MHNSALVLTIARVFSPGRPRWLTPFPLLVRSVILRFAGFFSAVAVLRVCMLALAASLIWIWHYERWTWESWQIPTDYAGDSLEILARIEAAAAGDTAPLRPQVLTRLGAPFGANWSSYPASDLPLMWAMGRLARITGVNAAANLALLLASVTSALSFYGCARWLRWRWEWSFAAALVFAFTFQAFGRGLPHLLLVFSWTVPLALLSCALVAGSRRLRLCTPLGIACLAVAVVLGMSNPYTLFLYLQLMLWSLVIQALGARRRENVRVGFAALALAGLALCLVQVPVWWFTTDTAATSPLVRSYGGTERYALKPVELFLPPSTHRAEVMAFFGHRYLRWSDWRGEAFAAYLGVVGIAGLLWLAGESVVKAIRRKGLPGSALPAFWVLAFASVGGITNIMAFFTGLYLFRATNRFSIFLSAIALMFLASRLSRLSVRWPRWAILAGAAIVGTIGVWEELPRRTPESARRLAAERVRSDAGFGRRLEASLPRGGMVFQLPAIVFPETQTPYRMGDYEHFRPYLATNTLRFTYGSLRGRCRGRWQRELGEASPREIVSRLERYGFSAIYINRNGYADRAEGLLKELTELGCSEPIEDELKQQVVVRLKPRDDPRLPLARGLTPGYGWHQPPLGSSSLALPRWAWGETAGLSYFNPYPHAINATLKLKLGGVKEAAIVFRMNGEQVGTSPLSAIPKEVVIENVTLQPGPNRLDLVWPEPGRRLSHERGQLRSFGLFHSEVVLSAASSDRAPSGN